MRIRHPTTDGVISPDAATAGHMTAPKHLACHRVGQDTSLSEAPLGGSSHFVLIQKTPSFESLQGGAKSGGSATAFSEQATASVRPPSVPCAKPDSNRQLEPVQLFPKARRARHADAMDREEEVTLDTPDNRSCMNLLDGGRPIPVCVQVQCVEGLETPPRLVRGTQSACGIKSAGSVKRDQSALSEIPEPKKEEVTVVQADDAHQKELATLRQMLERESEERRELEARHQQLLEHTARHENMSRELASELHDAMTLGASLRRQLEQLAATRADGSQETTDEEASCSNTLVEDFQTSPQDACESAIEASDIVGCGSAVLHSAIADQQLQADEAEEHANSKAAEPDEHSNMASISTSPATIPQEEQEEKEQENSSMNQCSGEGYTSQVYISVEPDGDASGASEALTATPMSPRAALLMSPRGARVRRNATAALVAAVSVNLSVRDLSEIKALKRPPPPLRMLMEVCCILFGIQPTKQVGAKPGTPRGSQLDFWEPARRHLLSDPFLPAKLREFDASRLTATQRARVVRCLAEPEFTADRVMNCSKAAAELYFWVRTVAERPGFAPSAGSVALARNRTPQRDPPR